MIARLDRLQAEQLARFVHEQHDRIAGGIAVTDTRQLGSREVADVTGFDERGEETCRDRLFGSKIASGR